MFGGARCLAADYGAQAADNGLPWAPLGAVPQREADLVPLYHRYQTAEEGPAKAEARRHLEAEASGRHAGRALAAWWPRQHPLHPAELGAALLALSLTAASFVSVQVSRRAELDASVHTAVQHLLTHTNALALLRSKYGELLAPELLLGGDGGRGGDDGGLAELLVGGELPRPAGAALVDDWDCLRVSCCCVCRPGVGC